MAAGAAAGKLGAEARLGCGRARRVVVSFQASPVSGKQQHESTAQLNASVQLRRHQTCREPSNASGTGTCNYGFRFSPVPGGSCSSWVTICCAANTRHRSTQGWEPRGARGSLVTGLVARARATGASSPL